MLLGSSQVADADGMRVLTKLETVRRSGDAADEISEKARKVLDLCQAGMD